MRIIAGKYRHREIVYPDNPQITRPTKDRVREAIFSALGDVSNFEVLDLFAGSGSLGLESLSRGASKCIFVDNDKMAINSIKENLNRLNETNFELLCQSDKEALTSFLLGKKFDLIFMDPPYRFDDYIKIINIIIQNSLIKDGGKIVVEHSKDLDFKAVKYTKLKSYHYGEIMVDIIWL